MYLKTLSQKDKKKLEELYKKLTHNTKYYAGYPPNTQFDYSELYDFLQFSINNLGDPFIGRNTRSSHKIEAEALQFFAEMTEAPKDFKGYVTNGSTEGNLYGLYLARKKYPEAIAYYSSHSHYSIPKNLDLLQIKSKTINSQESGEIDYALLEKELSCNRQNPVIIVANLGTVVTGAIDNIAKIKKILSRLKIKNYFIHADAALNGMILPFVENPEPFKFSEGIDCITISGHKLIGSPIPCGIVLTRNEFASLIYKDIEYVGKPDTTISGSRNGVTPVFLWYAIKRMGKKGFSKLVKDGVKKTDYALNQLANKNIPAWKHKNSLTVVFPAPSEKLLKKWNIPVGYGYSHMVALPKLTYQMMDELCEDLSKDLTGVKYNVKKSEQLFY
jgi:histidine decarboxylase